MKKLLTSALLCALMINVLAQETNRIYGKASSQDFQMLNCDFEPDAPAVVIFDEGSTIISRNDARLFYILERKVRIKIFTEAGLSWSEVEIPYYNSKTINENVYDINARSYNIEEGKVKIVELNPSECFDEKINANWNRKKFAIPNTRPGTIIEYSYRYQSDYMFNLPDWEFQWKIPVMNSRYKIAMVPFYEYTYILQGANKFDEFSSNESSGFEQNFFGVKFKEMIYSFGMKNIKSFKDESFITSASDYIMKIDFQLARINHANGTKTEVLSSWPMLIKELLDDQRFGKMETAARKEAPKILNINQMKLLTENQRFDSIVSFVKKNYSWNGKYSLYSEQTMKNFLSTRKGNSAEINLFTTGLLNAAGIITHPVILSNRSNGKIKKSYPFLSSLNNTIFISRVEGNMMLSDATNPLLANNRIPTECLNETGLIIEKGRENWIGLYSRILSNSRTTIYSTYNNGVLSSNITHSSMDYDGLYMRSKYGDNRNALLKHLAGENEQVIDSSLVITNNQDATTPYKLVYKVENRPASTPENIYIQPFLKEAPGENIFKEPTRTYPVDLIYPYKRSYHSVIEIPLDYEPEFIPEVRRINMNDLAMEYQANVVNNTIQVSLTYIIKKSIFQPDEYKTLRFFFGEMVNKANEKIILKRKTI